MGPVEHSSTTLCGMVNSTAAHSQVLSFRAARSRSRGENESRNLLCNRWSSGPLKPGLLEWEILGGSSHRSQPDRLLRFATAAD